MKKLILFLIFIPILSFGQDQKHSDGPYIFIENSNLVEKNIVNGKIFSKILEASSFDTTYYHEKSTFNNIREIAVLSDIHGQYDILVDLLTNNKIIDDNLNWSFGEGHLVITGDIFDRGDKVNEVLWFIYNLESQAKNKGGYVHYLLGNHEYMILYKDLRYLHPKYNASSELLNMEYDELYGDKTIIGRWLRSKSTIIKINNILFTHGGISEDFISFGDFNIEQINSTMIDSIPQSREEINKTDFHSIHYGARGLVWYRGYFKKYNPDITHSYIRKILRLVDANHVVVGHTTQEQIVNLFSNKIFGVDSGLKYGKYGEVLIIRDKGFFRKAKFFRGTLSGELNELKPVNQ